MFCPNCGNQTPDVANNCPNCGASLNAQQQSQNYQSNPINNGGEPKSKLVAGLLGIFLGGFGVHNFYLGYNRNAWIQAGVTGGSIILTAISCGILGIIGIPASTGMGIWGLVEGIMILAGNKKVDGNGEPLKD